MRKYMLAPGLNMSPDALNDFQASLIAQGHSVYVHRHRYQEIPNQWIHDFEQALLKERPDFIIAHSLGAMLALNSFAEKKVLCPMLLLCPPLVLNKSSQYFLKAISKLPFNIKVPSFNLKAYRVNSFTTSFDYRTLLELIEKVGTQIQTLKNNPKIKLAYIDGDELVDSKRSLPLLGGSLLYKQGLGPKHLFIDRLTCGEENYFGLLELL